MGHNRRVTHPFHRFEKDIIGLFWKLWNRKHHQNHYHFLLLGLRPQLNKIHNPVLLFNNGTSVSPAVSAPNLRIIFDSHLTFEDQISSVSRACFYHIRDLRRIRSVKNFNTAKTIGTSFVHYRHDFCNSLYYGLPKTQLNHLQHIQNSLASAVVAAPRSSDADLILKSLHWLRVPERIEYKIASTTYKFLQIPLHNTFVISSLSSHQVHPILIGGHPQLQSSLKVTNPSFRYSAPYLWNRHRLSPSLKLPCSSATSPGCPPFSEPVVGLSHSVFHSRLKTHFFSRSFPP